MSEPFIGEIRIFPYSFAPKYWAYCDGQIMPIAQNVSLFSIIDTIYGGDGVTVFKLPNLQGRAPMHSGQAPGLLFHSLGWKEGEIEVELTQAQIPAHTHVAQVVKGGGEATDPTNQFAARGLGQERYYSDSIPDVSMAYDALQSSGASQPHENRQPYLTMKFCIALDGLYPPRY